MDAMAHRLAWPEMPSTPDHYAAFLGRIAADPAARPDDPGLARVARAAAGEPPARLRARLLLERAAYRIVATEDTLRDIVAESGFPSAEVFNRAFRREHGVLPSVWRADPTTHLLDSPGDVHFHPPAGLRLPPRHRMDGVDLVVEMVEHHVERLDDLVAAAALVADAVLDVPLGAPAAEQHAAVSSPRAALSLLVAELEQFDALVHDAGRDVTGQDVTGARPSAAQEPESLPSIRRRLDRAGPAFVDDVSLLAATGRFDETFVDASTSTPRVRSYGALVRDVLVDSGHLRLLVLARLRDR